LFFATFAAFFVTFAVKNLSGRLSTKTRVSQRSLRQFLLELCG
jgi:hypothetical protein